MYFRGRSTRSLDPKGRLMLPPEFRGALAVRSREADCPCGSGPEHDGQGMAPPANRECAVQEEVRFVLTTYDGCLVGFPWEAWTDMEEKFARLPNPSPRVRAFRRLFLGGAEVQSLDAQGRVRLSQDHREYAGLEKEVTIIGLLNRFEIWNPTVLKASLDDQKLDDVTEELAASGIDFAL